MRGPCVWWRLEAAGRPQLGRRGAELDDTYVVEHRPLTDEIRIAHIYGVAIARRVRPEVGVVELGVIRHQRRGTVRGCRRRELPGRGDVEVVVGGILRERDRGAA